MIVDDVQPRRWVDQSGLAKYLCVTQTTISRWTRMGHIPFISLGGKIIRYDLDEIDKFIAEHTVEAKRTFEDES